MNKCTQGLNRHSPKKMCNNQNSLCITDGNAQCCSLCGKQYAWFLEKLKIELPDDPDIPPLDMYPK